MMWLLWRKRVEKADEKLRMAEKLRDRAQDQQREAEELTPRVDAITASLRKLHTDNHFGPMIEKALRGSE